MKILANDGIQQAAIDFLQQHDFEVITTKVAQEQVANYINKNNIEILLVRSATKVTKEIIDACPELKLIGRGGVGMDNIEVAYAREKGIQVINTPGASSDSVAELVLAHLFTGVRFLADANRNMPLEGDTRFNELKKAYQAGRELRGKTLGIIGFGRIGQAVAKKAIALGMKVIASDIQEHTVPITLEFFDGQQTNFLISTTTKENVLQQSDFITLHTPYQNQYILDKSDFEIIKKGAGIINTSRGENINEVALIEALEAEQISFAGLDVYQDEPHPAVQILMHPSISLTPHIGAATLEAQERVGMELAEQIITAFAKTI